MRLRTFIIVAATLVAVPISANAAVIDWTTWSNSYTSGYPTGGTATGTAGSVGISYSGEVQSVVPNYPNGSPDYYYGSGSTWLPSTSYVGGIVGNAPPVSGGIVQLFGGASTPPVDTITFSTPVTDPVMAIWSLGQGGINASFQFIEAPVYQAGGPSSEYGGSSIIVALNGVYGAEGNGTVEFPGTFTSISWTNPTFEDWYGFTVGVAATPLPSTWTMLIAGFVGIGFFAYRGSRNTASAVAAAA
jgi:hypothetical protein